MNSKNTVHTQLFFEFKQFSKNNIRESGQALTYFYNSANSVNSVNSVNLVNLVNLVNSVQAFFKFS